MTSELFFLFTYLSSRLSLCWAQPLVRECVSFARGLKTRRASALPRRRMGTSRVFGLGRRGAGREGGRRRW